MGGKNLQVCGKKNNFKTAAKVRTNPSFFRTKNVLVGVGSILLLFEETPTSNRAASTCVLIEQDVSPPPLSRTYISNKDQEDSSPPPPSPAIVNITFPCCCAWQTRLLPGYLTYRDQEHRFWYTVAVGSCAASWLQIITRGLSALNTSLHAHPH